MLNLIWKDKGQTLANIQIEVGDFIRVHKNKDELDKEHISTWGDKIYRVGRITETFGQNCYFLDGYTQNGRVVGLLRHDILLTI